MFGAIVTAMVLTSTMVGLGVLDYSLVWVNPTYLGSGIVGGLIMGVGFIIGGFCPGTSLAAAWRPARSTACSSCWAALGGIFSSAKWRSSSTTGGRPGGYLGRFTLMDWLGVARGRRRDAGRGDGAVHVLGRGATGEVHRQARIEQRAEVALWSGAALWPWQRRSISLAPTTDQEVGSKSAAVKEVALADRQVQISPAELYTTMYDNKLSDGDDRRAIGSGLQSVSHQRRAECAAAADRKRRAIAAHNTLRAHG